MKRRNLVLKGKTAEENARRTKRPFIFSSAVTWLAVLVALLVTSNIGQAQTQGGTVVAWGNDSSGQIDVPQGLTNVVAVSGGGWFSLALNQDGTVAAWGDNSSGPTNLPVGLTNIIAISAGQNFALALKQDGTVLAWGDSSSGQTNLPVGLTNVIAVSAGFDHCLALKQDGTVVGWGDNYSGAATSPTGLSNVVAIAAGHYSSLVLLSNGTITGWGLDTYGQAESPNGASNFLAIASGTYFFNLALQTDGTVVGWGNGAELQLNTPSNLTNVVDISAGYFSGYALTAQGTITGWGYNDGNPTTVPSGLTNVVSVSAGWAHALAIVDNSYPKILEQPANQAIFSGQTASFTVYAIGAPTMTYQWGMNGTNLDGATNATLTIANAQPSNAGLYQVTVSNSCGTVLSSNCALSVVTTPPVFVVQPTNQVVIHNGSVTFTSSVTGSIPAYYQWLFNSTNIVGATNSSLLVSNVQYSNQGIYSVIASNYYGFTISSNVNLLVSPTLVYGFGFTNDDYGNYAGQIYPPVGLTNVIAIAAGGSHSLALNRDGTVVGWGDDNNGVSSYTTNLSNVVAIAAGWQHSVALKSDGTVVAWGGNGAGQTNVPSGLSNVVAIAAGGCDCGPDPSSTLALKNDGTVVGWGGTLVPSGLSNVVAIAAGSSQDLALQSDGTLISWGNVNLGGPSNGKATVVTNGITNVVAIACGESHALILKYDGTVFAWGNNYYGQTNVPLGLSNIVSIAASYNFNLALQNNGKVIGWGGNTHGQTTVPSSLTNNIIAIAAGSEYSLVLVNDETPVIVRQPIGKTVFSGSSVVISAGAVAPPPSSLQWQLNGTNVLGATNSYLIFANVQPSSAGVYTLVVSNSNENNAVSSSALLSVITSPPIIQTQPSNNVVFSGGSSTFAVSITGSLPVFYQWQFNGTNIANATNAVLTLTNLTWPNNGIYTVTISNSYGFVTSSNAILTLPRNLVVAWGNNTYGQTNVPVTLTNAITIAAGYENSMAVRGDGTITGWGYNGLNETIPPTGLSYVMAIATSRAASGAFSLALKSDGTVIGWGNNAYKQTNAPTGLSNVTSIAVGQGHGMALRNDGKVFVWGNNSNGQTNVPATLTNAIGIAAGYNCCLALQNNGSLMAWGDNTYGQTNIPSGLTNVMAIASGWYHCLALTSNGTLMAWGNNTYQQTNIPAGLTNVVAISTGQYHSLAVKNDGTVIAWGQNTYKQTNVPTGLNHVVTVTGGYDHSLALIEDGPPVIFSQPASQTNYAGFTVNLTGIASGLQPLNIQWVLNGTNINGATNTSLAFNLQPNLAGVYSFVCSNALGSVISSNALVGVITNAPLLTLQPTNQTAIAGSNVTFSVAVGAGPIPNTFQWQFNGTNIDGATNLSLTLTNIQTTNQGNYAVTVNNGYGTTTSSNAYLSVIVLDFPTALNTPGWSWATSGSAVWFAQTNASHDGFEAAQSGLVANGQSSTLLTTVTGPGTLTFWWMFSPLTSPFQNTLSFSSSLGNASASVNSTTGWQQKTIYLGAGQQTLSWIYSRYSFISAQSTGLLDQVSFTPGGTSPTLTSMSPNTFVRASAGVNFSVGAYGTPPLAYQWQLNGTNLLNKTNAFLSLTGVQPTNAGIYSVIITNSFGIVTTNAALWVGQFALNSSSTNLFFSTNGLLLQLDGILTTNPVVVFGSTDLVSWLPLFTNSPTTGSIQFLDVTATNMPTRFYRAQE
jgi:alpha-tubulin suppressor-like RCC1 family protein